MKLNFRQGLIKSRLLNNAPDFLQQNQNSLFVNINITSVPLIVTTSYGTTNYLIQEATSIANAWGPFQWNSYWGAQPSNVTYYLYWDINLATASISRGFTPYNPITSLSEPTLPAVDQHWYDLNTNITKVWNGSSWTSVCRVFAGSWNPGTTIIVHNSLGSQVGISFTSDSVSAGYILLGNDLKGINVNGAFLTSETDVILNQGSYTSPVRLEALSTSVVAGEPIGAYSCVTITSLDQIGLALGGDSGKLAIGIVDTDIPLGGVGKFIYSGMVYNQNWTWDIALGKTLYVGNSGEITQTVPPTGSQLQQIGTVISSTSIFLMPGVSGIVGPIGPQGNTGPIGLTGPQGIQGIVGPTGPNPDMTRLYPYDLSFYCQSLLNYPNATIGSIIILREVDIATNAPGSLARSMTPALTDCVITIKVNNVIVGNVTFVAGSTVGTIIMTQQTLLTSDIISIVSPSVLDLTLGDIMIHLTGYSRSLPL